MHPSIRPFFRPALADSGTAFRPYVVLTGWITFTFLLYFTFVTVVSVSYYSMTPELTRDYDERTILTTVRMIGGTLGYMIGAALPPLVVREIFTHQHIYKEINLQLTFKEWQV